MARSIRLIASGADQTGTTFEWPGGEGIVSAQGTWDGASVTIQFAPLDPITGVTTTVQPTDLVLTSAEPLQGFYPLPMGKIRAVVSGSGGTTSLAVFIGRYR